jgi:Protein of unknown function (DUF2905)
MWAFRPNLNGRDNFRVGMTEASDWHERSTSVELGKALIVVGAMLVVAGIVVMLLGRAHFPLGRLPGDFLYRGKNTTVYFPLATSIVVSVVLSIVLYVVSQWRR